MVILRYYSILLKWKGEEDIRERDFIFGSIHSFIMHQAQKEVLYFQHKLAGNIADNKN